MFDFAANIFTILPTERNTAMSVIAINEIVTTVSARPFLFKFGMGSLLYLLDFL